MGSASITALRLRVPARIREMLDCTTFEKRLLAGIPYRHRYDVENTLRAFQASRVMLQVYAQAVAAASPNIDERHKPIIVAFGSFGRLDGAPGISDYDVLFLYPGGYNPDTVTALRGLIRHIVSRNQALDFDHREAIEAGSFHFDNSPAYPVLSVEELLSKEHEVRALQLIIEGRAITDHAEVRSLRTTLLSRFGLDDNVYALDLRPLRDALDRMRVSYCSTVFGRLKAERRPLSNRKILKLFALREFSHLSSLLATAEVAISASGANQDMARIVQILSAPAILKVASFADPSGPLANLIFGVAPEVRAELLAIVRLHRDELLQSSGTRYDSTGAADGGEADLFRQLRGLTLPVLRQYDALIQLLHDPKFLALIDPLEPDITTWLGYTQFQRVLQHREDLVSLTKVLATALREMLDTVQSATRAPALNDAQESLTCVARYALDLGRAMPRIS